MINTCEICGCVFDARKSCVKTCSPSCKRKLQSRAMQMRYGRPAAGALCGLAPKVCLVCGSAFEPASGNQLTCSVRCSDARKRRLAKERQQIVEPESIPILPLHVAEDLCRRLGLGSYGAASAEAINCGLPLSRYLMMRAEAAGIEIFKEADA